MLQSIYWIPETKWSIPLICLETSTNSSSHWRKEAWVVSGSLLQYSEVPQSSFWDLDFSTWTLNFFFQHRFLKNLISRTVWVMGIYKLSMLRLELWLMSYVIVRLHGRVCGGVTSCTDVVYLSEMVHLGMWKVFLCRL